MKLAEKMKKKFIPQLTKHDNNFDYCPRIFTNMRRSFFNDDNNFDYIVKKKQILNNNNNNSEMIIRRECCVPPDAVRVLYSISARRRPCHW